jgi:hypothetical protein
MWMAYQVIRQTRQHALQALDDSRPTILIVSGLAVKVERSSKDEENTRNPLVQMKVNPSREFLPQPSRRDSTSANTTALTRCLQLRSRKRIDTLGMDELVIPPQVKQPGADLSSQEVVGTECIETHIPRHGDELRSGQVVEGEVIVEEFGNVDNVLG